MTFNSKNLRTTSIFNQSIKSGIYFLFFALLVTPSTAQTAFTGIRGITPLEATKEMAPGINLFNTLDAVCWWCNEPAGLDSETVWGNPFTTPEIVAAYADKGFKALRIPVTWFNHMGPGPDYIIDEAWMDRVEEVANYAFDVNMYVIINTHHDDLKEDQAGSWLMPTYAKQAEVTDIIEKVWTQIANRFKDYGDYLIFETMNEPREVGAPHEWSSGTAENRDVINALNLAAVNAIRATGGNNAQRFISIPQYAAGPTAAIESLVIPNNDPNIIVAIHYYSPVFFCLIGSGTPRWGTEEEMEMMQQDIKSYSDHFNKNGQAVIIGECGASNKDNYGDRVRYYDFFTKTCKAQDITPFFWFYELDRPNLNWDYPLLEDAIVSHFNPDVVEASDIILNKATDTLELGETIQLSATVEPNNATFQDVAWTSHNVEKATTNDGGLVTAIGAGTVKISATTVGKTTNFNLFVVDSVQRTEFFFEAEEFDEQEGIQTESTTDENGGDNIGHIQNGDWTSYSMSISTPGFYTFKVRAATPTGGGDIRISANGNFLGMVNIDGTKSNGWQDWYTTEPIELEFEEGNYSLKMDYVGGDGFLYNINWFQLDFDRSNIVTSLKNRIPEIGFQVYPNPFNRYIELKYTLTSRSDVDVKIFDIHGQLVGSLVDESARSPGKYSIKWRHPGLSDGIYLLKMITEEGNQTKKLVLNN